MDYHYSKKSKIVFGISILGLLAPIGSSLFVISDIDSDHTYNTTSKANAVAYIEGLDGIYFPTVSDAIIYAYGNGANDTIYVIPGDVDGEYTQSYINKDCILESRDTLIIPYEGKDYEDEDRTGENDYFADYNQKEEIFDYYLTSEVIISKGVTFTNYGTICVGGMLGTSASNSHQRPTGHVVNKYAQISMEYNSKLVNEDGGIIYSYGYIKERLDTSLTNQIEPCVENMDGSILYVPFVIYDYKGGSYTATVVYNGSLGSQLNQYYPNIPYFDLPLSIFDIPNIQSLLNFYSGSTMYGLATLYYYGSASDYEINVLGPKDDSSSESFLFELESGSLSFKYSSPIFANRTENSKTYTYSYAYKDFYSDRPDTNDDLVYTNINIYENSIVNIENFEVVGVDTSTLYIPLSYKFNITVQSNATVNVDSKIEFLSGSHLTIEENAYVNIYENTVGFLSYIYPEITNPNLFSYYPKDLGSANIINNGELYINAPFGGLIQTTKSTGKIITGEDFENACLVGSTTDTDSADYNCVTVYAVGKITNNVDDSSYNDSYKYFANGGSYTYESKGDFWYTESSNIENFGEDLEDTVLEDQNVLEIILGLI